MIDEERRKAAFREAARQTWVNRLVLAVVIIAVLALLLSSLWEKASGDPNAPGGEETHCVVSYCETP